MTTMLEKAARALYARKTAEPWEAATARMARLGIDKPSNNQEAAINDARAALQAIREPDNETAWALATASGTMNKNRAAQDWAAMIDAILSEPANP